MALKRRTSDSRTGGVVPSGSGMPPEGAGSGSPAEPSGFGRLAADARATLASHGIYQFGNALSLVFVNLYLWRLTNDLWLNGAYTLLTLLAALPATVYIGRVAKLRDRLFAYRLGIWLTALFYLLMLVFRERMVEFFVFFAILKGVSTAFYWLGHFTLIFDVSTDDTRHRYLGWNSLFTNAANLTGPALAGWLIDRFAGLGGYYLVFGLAFVMFAVSAALSHRMRKRPAFHRAYYLKYTGLLLRKRADFRRSLIGWWLVGLPQGILMYVPSILLYEALSRESQVGYLNAFFLVLSMASSYVLAKRGRNDATRFYLAMSAWGLALSSAALLVDVSLWTVILFMCVMSLFRPVQANAYTAHYYRLVGEMPLKDRFRVESVVIREAVINLGRAAGVVLFMLVAGENGTVWLPWVMFIVMMLQLAVGPLVLPRRAAGAWRRTAERFRPPW